MQVSITKEFNVLTRLIENYPEIGAMAKLLFVSKDVKKLVLSTSYLIVPSYTQAGKRCLLKPEFLRKFPNLKQVYANKNIPHDVKDETVGCHVLFDDVLPKIKGLCNIHAKIGNFLWYAPSNPSMEDQGSSAGDQGSSAGDQVSSAGESVEEWEKEERHLENISLLQLFVGLCKENLEETSYVVMTQEGIFSIRIAYNGEACRDQRMTYSLSDKTFHNGSFIPYDIGEEIEALYSNEDEDLGFDESQAITDQVYARYKRYLQVLSQIEIKNMNDMCFRAIYEIAFDDLEVIRMFKDLEGIVCVDFINDEDACMVQDFIDIFSPQDAEIAREFLKPIKHYYLLSYNKGFVSYINDATMEECETLATVISNMNGGQPLTQVLTFPDVDEDNIEYVRDIFPNAKTKKNVKQE